MTQEEMAEELGVSVRTLKRWEGGEVVPSQMAVKGLVELLKGLRGNQA